MNPSQLFQIYSTLVLPGWLLLVFAPRWGWTEKIITGIIITILAFCYVYCIAGSLDSFDTKSFSTLGNVMKLFTNEIAVLAGWIHYLAFDLMTGLFEVKNAQKHRINHLLLIPCLFLTFMFGPIGLLLFFIMRIIKNRQYFSSNF